MLSPKQRVLTGVLFNSIPPQNLDQATSGWGPRLFRPPLSLAVVVSIEPPPAPAGQAGGQPLPHQRRGN